MRRSALLAGLCGVVLLAGGVGAGYFLRPAAPPASLAASAPRTSAPATPQQYTDTRKIQVRLVPGADVAITANRSGVLTSTTCVAGTSIASGTTAARIDDTPVLALHLDVPPFRDLAMNVEGADVAALQTELNRLGIAQLEADGHFGGDTAVAVDALRDQLNMSDGRTLALDELLWLPQESIAVTECSAALGAQLLPGAPLAVAKGTLQQVVIESPPSDLVAGDRTLTVFGVTGAFGGGNSMTDAGFLAELGQTDQAKALLAEDPSVTAPATLQLTTAVPALQVPAAAVFGISGGTGCIQSGETTYPVMVLGSTLGASLVALQGDDEAADTSAPEEVSIGAAITHDSCNP